VKIDLWDLLIDDVNREKMHAHGIKVRQAFDVVEERPRLLRNYVEDGAAFLLVGPDRSGTFVTLPIDPTAEYGTWRPRTGYPSKLNDIARYHQVRS
jgi:hypothetical protein